jgi:hypothetical protein
MNQINNGKKFVLINRDFYNKVCNTNTNTNEQIIKYRISEDTIDIIRDNNEALKFQKNEFNIIDIDNAVKDKSKPININVSNNIDKICTDIINYYNIEMNFQTKLNIQNSQEQKYDGFFVDKEWDDKWKKYSYYDIIKTRYLINNISDKDTITKVIKEEQAKNYLNYDELNDVEKHLAKNIKEVYNSIKLSKKSYSILNQKFLKQFEFKNKINPLPYSLSNQRILIKPPGESALNCIANNNIIISYQNIKINNEISNNNDIQMNNNSLNKSMQIKQIEHYQKKKI